VSPTGRQQGLKKETKKMKKEKSGKSKNGDYNAEDPERLRQTTQRRRSWTLTAPATLPNEQAVAALPCIQHILHANRLTWSGPVLAIIQIC
jgi:hypothetical protein